MNPHWHYFWIDMVKHSGQTCTRSPSNPCNGNLVWGDGTIYNTDEDYEDVEAYGEAHGGMRCFYYSTFGHPPATDIFSHPCTKIDVGYHQTENKQLFCEKSCEIGELLGLKTPLNVTDESFIAEPTNCPATHPFAFNSGHSCCKFYKRNTSGGTCDGTKLQMEDPKACCDDFQDFAGCLDTDLGCKDRFLSKGKMLKERRC